MDQSGPIRQRQDSAALGGFHVFPLLAKLKEPTVSRNQEKAVQSFKLNQLRNVE